MAKPKYTEEKGAPLRFLKFLEVILVIGMVFRLFALIAAVGAEDAFSLCYRVVDILLISVAALQLPARKWVGVLSVYGWALLYTVDRTLGTYFLYLAGEYDTIGAPLGTFVAGAGYTVLLWVYFSKRRLLFSPLPKGYTPPAPPAVDISDIPCEVVEEYHSDYKIPSSVPPPANAAFTIQPPKPQPAPAAPAKPRKALRGAPVWSWVVICVLSLSCCVLAFTTFSAHQHIGELEREVESKASLVSSIRKWNDSLTAKADKYQAKASYFDSLCRALSGGNLGYASSSFRASKSVFFLNTDSDPEEFTLTTTYSGGGTVNLDASPYSVAHIVFNEDTWYNSTTLTVYPIEPGVATFTFSNTVNSQTFKVVVVVTELTPLS